jgi:hypothetical protein
VYKNDGDFDVYMNIADIPELNVVKVRFQFQWTTVHVQIYQRIMFWIFRWQIPLYNLALRYLWTP